MEAVRAAIARHGKTWSLPCNKEMEALYEPLHAAQLPAAAASIDVEKGIKYGAHAKHKIDVYSPRSDSTQLRPAVVFFHGGGFTAGDTDITPSMHGNIGYYFARSGCVCFLATYRLLPEARFPSGGEDVATALKWVHDHAAQYGVDGQRITAVGQSAGGAHLANAVFAGRLVDAGVALQGLVLLSVPFWYDLTLERRRQNMMMYHNTDKAENVLDKTGVAVFQASSPERVLAGVDFLQMVAELDSDEIVNGNLRFVEAFRHKCCRMPLLEVMAGHNHISNTLEIGLPSDLVGPRILRIAIK